MKLLSYADIMDNGKSVFTCSAQTLKEKLVVNFKGEIRVEQPYKHLSPFLDDLTVKLGDSGITETELNFVELKYCNSNGFYALMDIIELIYKKVGGQVIVRRVTGDDWHSETLPILLDVDEEGVAERTVFLDQTPL